MVTNDKPTNLSIRTIRNPLSLHSWDRMREKQLKRDKKKAIEAAPKWERKRLSNILQNQLISA